MTQTRCEHMCRRWSAQERFPLVAFVLREGPVFRHILKNATYAAITDLRYLLKGTLQGETKLCQK
jgi:hypothetical protein